MPSLVLEAESGEVGAAKASGSAGGPSPSSGSGSCVYCGVGFSLGLYEAHLGICRRRHPHDLAACPHNATHLVPGPELPLHAALCVDRDFAQRLAAQLDVAEAAQTPLPVLLFRDSGQLVAADDSDEARDRALRPSAQPSTNLSATAGNSSKPFGSARPRPDRPPPISLDPGPGLPEEGEEGDSEGDGDSEGRSEDRTEATQAEEEVQQCRRRTQQQQAAALKALASQAARARLPGDPRPASTTRTQAEEDEAEDAVVDDQGPVAVFGIDDQLDL